MMRRTRSKVVEALLFMFSMAVVSAIVTLAILFYGGCDDTYPHCAPLPDGAATRYVRLPPPDLYMCVPVGCGTVPDHCIPVGCSEDGPLSRDAGGDA